MIEGKGPTAPRPIVHAMACEQYRPDYGDTITDNVRENECAYCEDLYLRRG